MATSPIAPRHGGLATFVATVSAAMVFAGSVATTLESAARATADPQRCTLVEVHRPAPLPGRYFGVLGARAGVLAVPANGSTYLYLDC